MVGSAAQLVVLVGEIHRECVGARVCVLPRRLLYNTSTARGYALSFLCVFGGWQQR